MRVPVLIKLFAEALDCRCRIRWAMDWLIACFSGGLIHQTVVMSPGCKELATSTTTSSSLDDGLNDVGTNSAIVG